MTLNPEVSRLIVLTFTVRLDFRLHVFDTTAPPAPNVHRGPRRANHHPDLSLQTNMKVIKTIQGHPGRWTITDANLSSDNER